MDSHSLFATEAFVSGLHGGCALSRIPFAPILVLQQVPPSTAPARRDTRQIKARTLRAPATLSTFPYCNDSPDFDFSRNLYQLRRTRVRRHKGIYAN